MNVPQLSETSHSKQNAPKTVDFRVKYKTEKCRYWEQQRFCPFGQMCAFVHDQFEMRFKGEIHDHYKTRPCLNFNKQGYCKYGQRCLFLHRVTKDDRERTRSNSPNEQFMSIKVSNRHQQNLKLLAQFGFSVFQAHMNRRHSRIVPSIHYEQCARKSVSTEPDAINLDYLDQSYFGQDFGINENIINELKKPRMYSL